MIPVNLKTIVSGAKIVAKFAAKHAPTILTAFGVGCMAGGTVTAIVNAPKAKEQLDILNDDPELDHREYNRARFMTVLKYYWLTTLLTTGGAVMIFGGHHMNMRRIAGLTMLLGTRTEDLKKLEQAIVDTDGENKLRKYQDKAIQTDAENHAVGLGTVYNTGKGNTLCFDPIGKRFFLSDLDYITQQEQKFNADISHNMQRGMEAVMSLNNWYEYIDLPPLDGNIEVGDRVVPFGPNIGKDLGWRNRGILLKKTAGMLSDGTTYIVIGYKHGYGPTWDLNIEDDYGTPYDDETDMSWRGH